jgi:hypothetical protein
MTRETQRQLYQALKTHKLDLEITRPITSDLDLEVLDRRIEAARLLLEWLSRTLGPDPPSFPTAQTPPSSTAQADQRQTPPSAPDSPKTPRR